EGGIDEGVRPTWYRDVDGDLYGSTTTTLACSQPGGYVSNDDDCNDMVSTVNPAAPELCNNVNDDCDGSTDEPPASTHCNTLYPFAGVTYACTAGTCVVTACPGTVRDCDGSATNGCETDVSSSVSNCGGCGFSCSMVCSSSLCDDPVEIAGGSGHACARRASGRLLCWGGNANGQLGDGTNFDRLAPTNVSTITTATGVTAGTGHSCARTSDGSIYCWGTSAQGELGTGSTLTRYTPTLTAGTQGFGSVHTSTATTCAVRTSGVVACWGLANAYQVGDTAAAPDPGGAFHSVPRDTSIVDATQVQAGSMHACARRSGGLVQCWGTDDFGRLGDGAATHGACPTTDATDCTAVPVTVAG
ncbi:MAG: hypothetical protein FD127_4355, partial [Acidimicrobiaceae bacterium]